MSYYYVTREAWKLIKDFFSVEIFIPFPQIFNRIFPIIVVSFFIEFCMLNVSEVQIFYNRTSWLNSAKFNFHMKICSRSASLTWC